MFMADRIALMRAGRIVQLGTPANLYYQPSEAFVASFFGEINSLVGIVEAGEVAPPFGTVAAAGLPDGAAVPLLIRTAALHLTTLEDGLPLPAPILTVIASRLQGSTSLVHQPPRQFTHGA